MTVFKSFVSITRLASWLFTALALLSFALLLAILIAQSAPVWHHASLGYITGAKWFFRTHQFGALPMIFGTFWVSAIALVLAAPVGIGAAIFTAEYLPRRARLFVKILIELLAGVPSVVYGLLGILVLRDWIARLLAPFDPLSGDTLITAGVLLAIMILPTIVTLTDDALRAVPADFRHAARSLGLTRGESILSVTIPHSFRGIIAALLLALGRALGETIAVFLVVGRQDNNLPANLLSLRPLVEAGQTLTSKLGGSETNIAYGDSLHWAAIVGLALLLMLIVCGATILGAWQRRTADA